MLGELFDVLLLLLELLPDCEEPVVGVSAWVSGGGMDGGAPDERTHLAFSSCLMYISSAAASRLVKASLEIENTRQHVCLEMNWYVDVDVGVSYPLRTPPAREAPEPVSPADMARMEVERQRLEASGRAALMMDVRNMVIVGMGGRIGRDAGICAEGEEVVRRARDGAWLDGQGSCVMSCDIEVTYSTGQQRVWMAPGVLGLHSLENAS